MAERLTGVENATAAKFRFRSRLDGIYFAFRFLFNVRGDYWTLSLATSEGDPLLDGRKVVEGQDMLAQFKDPRLPPGQLFVDDTAGQDFDPGRNDLGRRVRIRYVPEAEVV